MSSSTAETFRHLPDEMPDGFKSLEMEAEALRSRLLSTSEGAQSANETRIPHVDQTADQSVEIMPSVIVRRAVHLRASNHELATTAYRNAKGDIEKIRLDKHDEANKDYEKAINDADNELSEAKRAARAHEVNARTTAELENRKAATRSAEIKANGIQKAEFLKSEAAQKAEIARLIKKVDPERKLSREYEEGFDPDAAITQANEDAAELITSANRHADNLISTTRGQGTQAIKAAELLAEEIRSEAKRIHHAAVTFAAQIRDTAHKQADEEKEQKDIELDNLCRKGEKDTSKYQAIVDRPTIDYGTDAATPNSQSRSTQESGSTKSAKNSKYNRAEPRSRMRRIAIGAGAAVALTGVVVASGFAIGPGNVRISDALNNAEPGSDGEAFQPPEWVDEFETVKVWSPMIAEAIDDPIISATLDGKAVNYLAGTEDVPSQDDAAYAILSTTTFGDVKSVDGENTPVTIFNNKPDIVADYAASRSIAYDYNSTSPERFKLEIEYGLLNLNSAITELMADQGKAQVYKDEIAANGVSRTLAIDLAVKYKLGQAEATDTEGPTPAATLFVDLMTGDASARQQAINVLTTDWAPYIETAEKNLIEAKVLQEE